MLKAFLPILFASGGTLQAFATASSSLASSRSKTEYLNAEVFSCPANAINKCTEKQKTTWDWSDLAVGSISTYAGFEFKGWTCESYNGKLDNLQGRALGTGKAISGVCSQGDHAGISMGVGVNAGVNAFSIDSFDMSTDFDARLEFHYDMPDGSVCKQTNHCKPAGSTIVNSQCGGAKNVRIIYPKQVAEENQEWKDECKVFCHKIKWHCSNELATSKSVSEVSGSANTATQKTSGRSQILSLTATAGISSNLLSTYDTTSAPLTASNKTFNGCGAESSECPGRNSSYIMPITALTGTTVISAAELHSQPNDTWRSLVLPSETKSSSKSSVNHSQPPHFPWNPHYPIVVPRCLNTFMYLKTQCKDNQDIACYCPNQEFVNAMFECIYAHGENDDIISQAAHFFQGICHSYLNVNPGITDGAHSIAEIITVTGSPLISSSHFSTDISAATATSITNSRALPTELTDSYTPNDQATTQQYPTPPNGSIGNVITTNRTGIAPFAGESSRAGATLSILFSAIGLSMAAFVDSP